MNKSSKAGKRKIKSQMRKTVRIIDDFSPNIPVETKPVIGSPKPVDLRKT
jgi:hypothetical protein